MSMRSFLVCRPLILNKSKILLASASSAYQHSIKEILANPAISSQIKAGTCSPEK